MITFLKGIVHFFFPESCILCEAELTLREKHVCASCFTLLPPFQAIVLEADKKFMGRVNLDAVLGMYVYTKNSYVQKMIHSIKYQGKNDLAIMLGEEFALTNDLSSFDLVIPVPLHKKRFLKRGYNQSMEWAKGISIGSGVEVKSFLQRTENTTTQTKKSRIERWENVENCFTLIPDSDIIDKRILLVDDVMTTGATIEACAHVLLKSGAKSVGIAAIGIAK